MHRKVNTQTLIFYNQIICLNLYTGCTHGSAKIVGGPSIAEGTLQVCDSFGQWSQVCDHGWSQEDALVACRSMGFSNLGK